MKFVIERNELTQLVGNVQNVVGQKSTIPILSNFLIEALDNELVITATDLTVGTRCRTPAKIIEKGATTLPAKRFYHLIKELTAANIEVSAKENNVIEINANTSRFKLHGMDNSTYPELPDLASSRQFTIEQGLLREMLLRTAFAVSREDNRYILTGLLMQISEGKVIFVGTDAKRLSRMETTISVESSKEECYVLPLKAVEEIIKMLRDTDEEAVVYLMENKVAVQANNVIVITKLLSGEYPDFHRVIPKSKTGTDVVLHCEELKQLLRQISLFIAEQGHSVCFTFCDNELILTANDMTIGEGKVSMPLHYEGEKLHVAFNPNFFIDVIRHTKDEAITLNIIDAYNPGVITDSTNALFLIMPMRLNEE